MQARMCSEYLQKLKITKVNIDSEYIGADTELSAEILDFLVLKSGVKAGQKRDKIDDTVFSLDEYELAMVG